MATQSIEVKDFTGGRNFLTSPFNIYPTEAAEFSNISLSAIGMRTSNFRATSKLIPARGTGPYSVAPKESEVYPLSHAKEALLEKVVYFQGERYIINGGVPYMLGANGTKHSTIIELKIGADAKQTQHTTPADGVKVKAVSYTYYMSYRSKRGFESPLKDIGFVVGHKSWDVNFTKETASNQEIHIDKLPATDDYLRIYRMGDNISVPSLVCQLDSTGAVNLSSGSCAYDAQSNILSFSLLDDMLGNHATTWGAVRPKDLKYLASTKYGLAACNGSQLYLSMNRPDAWGELNMLNLGSNITGLASVYRGVVAFTEASYMYLITGSSTDSLQVNVVSTDIGCASNSSIAAVGHRALIWVYNRRFYEFNGSHVKELEPNTYDFTFFAENGYQNDVTAVSGYNKYIVGNAKGLIVNDMNHRYKPFLDYSLQPEFLVKDSPAYIRQVLHNGNKELGAYRSDGAFYVLEEFIYGNVEYKDKYPGTDDFIIGCYTMPPSDNDWTCPNPDTSLDCLLIGVYNAVMPTQPLHCPIGAVIGRYNIHTLDIVPIWMESNYLSPMFTFGDMNGQVTFSSVEILFEGELDVFVYVDDVQIKAKIDFASQRKGTARILLPNDKARGNYLQLQLRFNGAVYGYRVNGEVLSQYSK